jgi:ferredoxin-fold anticodon binding domain-containing protein
MCGKPFRSLTDVILGLHFDQGGYTGKDITFHRFCLNRFHCIDGIDQSCDPDAYELLEVVSESEAKKRRSRLQLTKVVDVINFDLRDFDPELANDAVLARDARGVIAVGIYDGPTSLFEVITKDSKDPLHQRLLRYFRWN